MKPQIARLATAAERESVARRIKSKARDVGAGADKYGREAEARLRTFSKRAMGR